MQTTWDLASSTDIWSISAGGKLMKVVNLTGFTVPCKSQVNNPRLYKVNGKLYELNIIGIIYIIRVVCVCETMICPNKEWMFQRYIFFEKLKIWH